MVAKVHWGAIFAGAFLGIAAVVFFSLFALATGIQGVNVVVPIGSTISIGAAFYSVLTSLVAFGFAGYCTVRLARIRHPGIACLHALTAFAVAGTLVPFVFTRTFLVGSPGFAIMPPPGMLVSPGLAWAIFLSFGLAAVGAAAGGVQACYGDVAFGGVSSLEGEGRRAA